MKMFGFFNNNRFNNQNQNQNEEIQKNQFRSISSQFNLASIMKLQSTGCKSCRG
jgi:hypothetical protein